jgi:1A family penicillin-binding protein
MEEHPKRTYGYVKGKREISQSHDRNHTKTSKDYSDSPKMHKKKHRPFFVSLFLFPFTLIKALFIGIWSLFSFAWTRSPKISNSDKKNLFRTFLKFTKYAAIIGFIFFVILTVWSIKDLPDINNLGSRNVHQSTKIYDRTGTHLLHEFYADQKRTIVEFDALPKNLINGVIATEDTSFYTHYGVRPLSIARALVYGVLPSKRIGGTSTLTQQLVKNAILTNERTVFRKAREIILSVLLEQKFNKNEILKIYFNEIPYGSTNYGIESASESYFGKSVRDLTLAESATLAGLPKAPTKYLSDLTALKERRNFVLRRMNEEGYISEEQKIAAQAEDLNLNRQYGDGGIAPHFVLQYVKENLVDQFGEQMVDTGGLKVITTLDYEKQMAATNAAKEYSQLMLDAGGNNMALVALDPKTSQILAMVGSRDFNDKTIGGEFNVAVKARRQPGSSIKPIMYAAAFEKGYTPDTILFDVATNFSLSEKEYKPLNYDLQERGPVTMRQSLQGSLNIPAVQTMYLVGEKKGVEFAKRLGYSTFDNGDFGLSLVLGGGAVSMLEHVNAYGVFANNGVQHAPAGILKVSDDKGNSLYEWKQVDNNVLDSKITATLSNVLSDDAARAYVFGAGGPLTLPGRPVAAKTGTTNEYKDAWTVGYTPSLVAGVWAGNSDNSKMKAGYGGSKVAAQIWNKFMADSLKDTPIENFPAPPPNDAEKPILRGSTGGGVAVKVDRVTGKLATSSTPEKYIEERIYIQPHSILYYVNKDDPRGPVPTDPNTDQQFAVWEKAIQDWIVHKKEKDPNWNISFEEPPTEFDDAHSLELIPTLEVVFPTVSSTLTSRRIDTDIRVSATRGVSKVTYKIDSKFVDVVKEHPFNLNYTLRGIENGPHTITIIVEDDIGNLLDQTIPFILDAGEEKPGVFFRFPEKTLSLPSFPRTVLLTPLSLNQVSKIELYSESKNFSEKNLISSLTDFTSMIDGQIPIVWIDPPNPGFYTLTLEITQKDGKTYISDSTDVEVTQ